MCRSCKVGVGLLCLASCTALQATQRRLGVVWRCGDAMKWNREFNHIPPLFLPPQGTQHEGYWLADRHNSPHNWEKAWKLSRCFWQRWRSTSYVQFRHDYSCVSGAVSIWEKAPEFSEGRTVLFSTALEISATSAPPPPAPIILQCSTELSMLKAARWPHH